MERSLSGETHTEFPVRPGDVVAGKYTVERVLGVGGMGVVVAARHIHLDEHVAIKFMLPEVAAKGGELVARFMREGRAAAKIRSEHIARVADVGALDNGAPYLVMEYLHGRDLQQLLQEQRCLPVADALDFVLQASEAIAEAHARGIVHRDLKPANLFLTHRADGSTCVKVLDFGISKMAAAGESGVTRTQTTMGSPLYMSPEQVMSAGNVDARADVWSLGVIIYQLVTGVLPFEADTIGQLVFKVVQQPARPLRDLMPDVHPALDAAVARCLEKDRGARFQTVGELALALAPAAPGSELSIQRITRVLGMSGSGRPPAFVSTPGVGGTPLPPVGLTPTPGRTPLTPLPGLTPLPTPRSSGGSIAVLVGFALLVLVGGAVLAWSKLAGHGAAVVRTEPTTSSTRATPGGSGAGERWVPEVPVVLVGQDPHSYVDGAAAAPDPAETSPLAATPSTSTARPHVAPPPAAHAAVTPPPVAPTVSAHRPAVVIPDDRQ